MVELKRTWVIFLLDINPDVGNVSQMIPIAYTEEEFYAKGIAEYFNKNDDSDPNRTYKYTQL